MTPIPGDDAGAPLKQPEPPLAHGRDVPIPGDDAGAPLKPLHRSAGGAVPLPIPGDDAGAPLKPVLGQEARAEGDADPRRRRRGSVEASWRRWLASTG